jgi:WD40 repeat protein
MTELTEPVEPRTCPYFGLDYYQEKFGPWFFGRESEGDKIITNLLAARLTLLHAESGVGKSSLLRAGVAWRLRQLARKGSPSAGALVDLPVVFSSWRDDPVKELISEIRTATEPFLAHHPAPRPSFGQLDAAIEEVADAANATLLVILDQFEEYFIYCSREPTPEHFADELARCINRADVPANFLIAIREDAYAGLGDLFKGRIANVYGNYLHIEYLDRACAEQAIRAPLEVYNRQPGIAEPVTIQDELVEAVLDQVRAYDAGGDPAQGRDTANGEGGRVATPLLQLVMERVWQQELRQGSHELRLATLQSMQGVEKIVDAHLVHALQALDSGERQTAIDMFDHLVTPSGGKIAESVPDLAHRTGHGEDRVGSVLDKLDRARIVRPVPAPPGQDPRRFRRYEIFHDVLAPAINNAITAREEQRRARARLRGLAVAALGLAIAAMVVLVIVLVRANSYRQITGESRQLAAAADVELARDPELSALLALQALRLPDYTSQAEAALRGALPQIETVRTFRDGTTVSSAVFDPVDANKVASAGYDGGVSIWNVKTGRRLVHMPKGGSVVNGSATAVAFNRAGTELAVGYGDGKILLLDAHSRKELQWIPAGSSYVNDVRFVGSTGELAVATDQNVELLLPRGGMRWSTKVVSSSGANTIAVDPLNPRKFAAATNHGTWIGRLQRNLHPMQPRWLALNESADAEFSPSGSEVVIAGGNGTLAVYDLTTFKKVLPLAAAEGAPSRVAFSPDGKMIIAGYPSGTALVWDASTGVLLTRLVGHASAISAAAFSANSREAVTGSVDGTIRVWHSRSPELKNQFASSYYADSIPQPAYAADYSPSGGLILTTDASGAANVFTSNGSLVGPIPGVSVTTARFNHAGTEIVTADPDRTVDLWRRLGSSYQQITLASPIRVNMAAGYADFSPDGSRIVVAAGYEAEVFSSQTGQWRRTLNPHRYFPLSIALFSPNGRQILTGDNNGQVEVWNATTGREIQALGTPGPGISDVAFNRSGSKLVTASFDGVVTIWAASNHRQASNYQQPFSFSACPAPHTANFSPDSSKVVVACGNGSVSVFNAATGKPLTALPATYAGQVNSAEFSPDSKYIIAAVGETGANGSTGGVQIWKAEFATSLTTLERLAEHRITRQLTPAERKDYLVGISG